MDKKIIYRLLISLTIVYLFFSLSAYLIKEHNKIQEETKKDPLAPRGTPPSQAGEDSVIAKMIEISSHPSLLRTFNFGKHLGKKIEAYEIKAVIIALLLPSAAILGFSAYAANCAEGLAGLNNAGPHGLSEILYAYTSAAANNGSAFAGLTANTPFYNVTLAIAMFIGRFGVIIPMIAIAASMSNKKTYALSSGSVKSDNATFTIFLACTVLILGALTFLPALTFTAIAEHILMLSGKLF